MEEGHAAIVACSFSRDRGTGKTCDLRVLLEFDNRRRASFMR